ncbi:MULTISPECIES: hypothetical protein [unclassified Nocardia]|uniref:hypothetical protein n=1 Tax=unclassified Nocardia TaxID=2637762 RepID=UPI001CE3B647|nr:MULTISPECIES: hypothetical protein [unclassified Nocardia]
MVTARHEAMHELFKRDPGVFARAFRTLGLPFDDPLETDLLSTDLTETEPLERRADTILRIRTATGTFLLLVEAQGKEDNDKPASWAYYLAFLRAKYTLPPVLLVVCQNRKVQAWARGPWNIGPPRWASLKVRPLVLGPDNVPIITDIEAVAADMPLAALSMITHAYEPVVMDIMEPVATVLENLENRSDALITIELIERGLVGSPALEPWRKRMPVKKEWFQGQIATALFDEMREEARNQVYEEARNQVYEEARNQIYEEARKKLILRNLEIRGIAVAADDRSKILACQDDDLLDRWFDRSAVANTIADVFA